MNYRSTQIAATLATGVTACDVRAACLSVVLPLARLLLRQGITAHEFGRIADRAFVAAAVELLAEVQQEANYSRIATLTGLNRHAVATIAENSSSPAGAAQTKPYQRNRLSRVLTGWFDDPAYTDAEGRPKALPLEGPAPSFTTLVRQFSGDIYARIILEELLRVKAVRMTRDGRVRVLSRRFTTGGASSESLRHLGEATRDLLSTLEHNLGAGPDGGRFEDSAVSANLPPEAVPLLRQLIERRGAAFIEDIQGWLAQHERSAREIARGEPTVRAGVAIHLIEDDGGRSPDSPKPARRRRRRGKAP